MDVWYCDHYVVELPSAHRFPMEKYALLRRALLELGVLDATELHPAEPATLESVFAVHDARYVDAILSGTAERSIVQRIGFPWSQALVRRSLASVGGTLAAAHAALREGFGGNLAGGTHHARTDAGAGYCVFNDIAVAARQLLDRGLVSRVLVLDVDVHQGDGTAEIFAGDETVTTCSIHGERNFPARKVPGDLDFALPDGTGDEAYLAVLEDALEQAFKASEPELVFVQGGVDPLGEDRLGRMELTHEGLMRRDRTIFDSARSRGVAVALCLGGGYSDPIDATLTAHVNTYRAAVEVFAPRAESPARTR